MRRSNRKVAIEHGDIVVSAPVDHVVATTALEYVIFPIAIKHVVKGAADQGVGIVIERIRSTRAAVTAEASRSTPEIVQ